MLQDTLGIRLSVRVGSPPTPLPYDAITALTRTEVSINQNGGDAFSLTFTLGKGQSRDFSLLNNGTLRNNTRVSLWVLIGTRPEALIDGLITEYRISGSTGSSGATLTVTGQDLSVALGWQQQQQSLPNQSPKSIIEQALGELSRQYPFLQVSVNDPIPSSTLSESERVFIQSSTPLAMIQGLAQQYGGVFYIDVVGIGRLKAYVGRATPQPEPQEDLLFQMGGRSNVDSFQFTKNEEAAVRMRGYALDTSSSRPQARAITPQSRRPDGLSAPTQPLREEYLHCGARFDQSTIEAQASARAELAPDTIVGSGELRTIRYGHVLRARRRVRLRGVGVSFNEQYIVRSVTHTLERGEYKQAFTLGRQGTNG